MGYDSVRIDGKSFRFFVPRRWNVISKDTGVCLSNVVNVRLEMPTKVPCSFGEIDISISDITYSEREFRKQSDTLSEGPTSYYDWIKTKKYNGYNLTNGHFSTFRMIQQAYWDSLRGGKPYSKKEQKQIKKFQGNTPIHYVSHWNHFLINDSLEILIQFGGDIPTSSESEIIVVVDYITQMFFTNNQRWIDSLLISADPYRLEPSISNYDSLFFLNTQVVYPILPGWTIDTVKSSTDLRTKVLQLDHIGNDTCNHASITMSFRLTKMDKQSNKEELTKLTPVELYELYKPYKDLSDPEKVKHCDSTFSAAERHYYFTRISKTVKSENCPTKLDYTETIFIVVYTKSKEKIRISLVLNDVTSDFIQERNYRHDLYRFVNLTSEQTDFEHFYLNN